MAKKVERLLPSLDPYPPASFVVVHHPDVQLTPEEWIELADYEKLESDALCNPGVVGFMMKNPPNIVAQGELATFPWRATAKITEGRGA